MTVDGDVEVCVVCRDVFDDPVMCADGFCYCRLCIARWVGGEEIWRSPRSNLLVRGACLLTVDVDRGARALEARRRRLREDGDERGLVALASSLAYAGDLVASPELCAALLPRAVPWTEPWQALALADRGDAYQELPTPLVEALLERDRTSSSSPLLTFRVLANLLRLLGARFRDSPNAANLRSAMKVLEHVVARAETTDAVVVPSRRAPGFEGIYYRDQDQALPRSSLVFVASDGRRLVVPLRSWKETCQAETFPQTVLLLPGSEEGAMAFNSEARAALPHDRCIWRDRRRERLPFPDYDGVSDDDAETAVDVPPGDLFEASLRHLPFAFDYLPRAPRVGAAREYIAEHAEFLAGGFRRRTRQRLR